MCHLLASTPWGSRNPPPGPLHQKGSVHLPAVPFALPASYEFANLPLYQSMPGVPGEVVQGTLHSWELCTLSFTHREHLS